MSKIRLIDILNKIANGDETPEEFKICQFHFKYDYMFGRYYEINSKKYMGEVIPLDYYLNDEIEIIEDTPKKIEKIPILKDGEIFQTHLAINQTRRKLNEIIAYINNMEK